MKKLLAIALIATSLTIQVEAKDYNIGTLRHIQKDVYNNKAYIYPERYWHSKNGCHSGWIVINVSGDGGKEAYATAMMAYALGRSVSVRVSEERGECNYYNYTTMIRLN